QDYFRVLVENSAPERSVIAETAAPRPPCRQRFGEFAHRGFGQGDEIDRMTPAVRFLAAERGSQHGHDRRQDGVGALPAGEVHPLERLVEEVEGMAAV